MASRPRALDRGPYTAHATPSRAIRAYTAATNEDIFSTQYAVRSGKAVGMEYEVTVAQDNSDTVVFTVGCQGRVGLF